MKREDLPLFPLQTVLFPGGPLSLRIFEPRYLDLVRDCTSSDNEFGVCLVNKSDDPEQPTKPVRIGTTARIVDFFTMEDGLLGIRACGVDRFLVHSTSTRANGLLTGKIERLPCEPEALLDEQFLLLRTVLERMLEQVGSLYPRFGERELSDATWVGYRLAELLPLEPDEKQQLLELEDAEQRLYQITELMPRFQKD
jgi:Lon protease-like protein